MRTVSVYSSRWIFGKEKKSAKWDENLFRYQNSEQREEGSTNERQKDPKTDVPRNVGEIKPNTDSDLDMTA